MTDSPAGEGASPAHPSAPTEPWADVEAAYRLLLGRPPESPAAREAWAGQDARALLAGIGGSGEFRDEVLAAFLTRRAQGAARFDEPAPPGLGAWAADALDLPAPARAAVSQAPTWGALLLELVDTPAFREATAIAPPSQAGQVALAAWRADLALASLRGAIEGLEPDRIEGWALDLAAPDRPLVVQAFADGALVGAARPDRFRRDLQDAHGGAGVYGFSLELSLGGDRDDARPVRIELRESTSQKRLAAAELTVRPQPRLDELSRIADLLESVRRLLREVEARLPAARTVAAFSVQSWDAYARAYLVPTPGARAAQAAEAAGWARRPTFGLRLRIGEAPGAGVAATVASLQAQSYGRWTLQMAQPTDRQADLDALLATAHSGALAAPDDPVDWLVILDAGDVLAPDALFRFAQALQGAAPPRVLYADDDVLAPDADGRLAHAQPRLRGAFDLLLALQRDEFGAFMAVEAGLARQAGAAQQAAADPARRYAYALEACARAGEGGVGQVARVLLHRAERSAPPPVDLEARAAAARAQLQAMGVAARVEPARDVLGAALPGVLRLRPSGQAAQGASVIIPTRDRLDLLRPCVDGLLATRDDNATPFELLIVDNASGEPETLAYLRGLEAAPGVRVLRDAAPFNWSRLNTVAAEQATGEVLVFLNNDTLPIARDWCDELAFWANWPGVGAVGARLVYADATLQHAGTVVGAWDFAAHEGVGVPASDGGYRRRHALARRVSAVTGACLAARRDVFQRLGGFDAARFAVTCNDVDYCLRAQAAGLSVIYAPQAAFHHFESKSRGFDANLPEAQRGLRAAEMAALRALWGERLRQDPWYPPAFERFAPPFTRLAALPG